ncbi:MAG: LamG-like jellyroll fold domain-containing protein [Planctomycetota bacterium]
MRKKRIALVVAVGAFLIFAIWSCEPVLEQRADVAPATTGYDAWRQHRDAVKQRPDILRYYTFETISTEKPAAPSEAGEAEPLTYDPRGEVLQVVEGRWPAKKAVRLDKGCLETKPFPVAGKAFTVECWFRKHGQGAELGNGRTNGIIFAQGGGYWDGVRVWTAYPGRTMRFEIGRPKPNNAFGLSVSDSIPDGVWLHIAATWDGKEMRLYLNGLLLEAAEYDGDYTAGGPFRIGFADAGVGSLKMDVDEVAVYRRALSDGEILRDACMGASASDEVSLQFADAAKATAQQNWEEAGATFEKIAGMKGINPAYRALACLGLARTMEKQRRANAAAAHYTQVFEDASAPERLRQFALRRCAYFEPNIANPIASRALYERLLDLPALGTEERIGVQLNLAEHCLREKDCAAARKQYDAVLAMPSLSENQRWNIRLQMAHTWRVAGDYGAARGAYEKIAIAKEAPAEFRSYAMLCAASTYILQKDYPAAINAFSKVQTVKDAPKHHVWEAEDRIAELKRMQQGLPARDPAAMRVKVPALPKPAVVFHVAPHGSDENPGTEAQPFVTLARARDAVREKKKSGPLPAGGATVFVRGGLHKVEKTFELTEADSGTEQAPVVYRAYASEKPVFFGGVRLRNFEPVADKPILDRLPEDARGKVWQTDLKAQGVTDLGEIKQRGYGFARYPCNPWIDLYFDGKPMQLARWPNEGFVKIGKVHVGEYVHRQHNKNPGAFEYEGDRPTRWTQAKDVWMFGLWGHLWAGLYLKVASIEPAKHLITTVQPSPAGFRQGYPYYCLNLLEEVDQPGEWYMDRDAGVLYLYPPRDPNKAIIELPVFTGPFAKMENVSHVTIRGLMFDLARADGAAIIGGKQNLIAGCTFRRLGGNGVVIDGGAGHGILSCDIHCVGACGTRVKGGERKTLTPGGHFIENNHIHDFSRIDRAYAPAVHMDGVGNRITHNLFNDSPHHAMRIEGYEHAVEFNEVHSVCYETDDQGGVDIWGNPAYRGLVFRYNFWHHIASAHGHCGNAGIRLDDMISDVLIYGNVFYRCSGGLFGGVQIHGGKDNILDNNVFVECKYGISFSPWGQKLWEERVGEAKSRVSGEGVDITKPPYSTRYPDLARMKENADRNYIWRSLVVDCGEFTTRERGVNEMMDNCAFADDPGFVAPAERDFALRSDSFGYDRFGFRPIPFDEIGLYQDELRPTWPVRTGITPYYGKEQ